SSHALIGGLIGAALVQSGTEGVEWHDIVHKVLTPALLAPMVAGLAAYLILLAIFWLFQNVTPMTGNRGFRVGQMASGTWVAFHHGANHAQKTMRVIALAR